MPTVLTAAECAAWLAEHVAADARAEVELKWALGYSFVSRDTIEAASELDEATGQIIQHFHGSVNVAAFTALYVAGKLRANFWFDHLWAFLEAAPLAVAAGERRTEPIWTALRAFAAYGSRPLSVVVDAAALLDAAWQAAPSSREVADVCVHALDIAQPFDGQDELLRQRAAEAVRLYPDDAVLRYRLARGERRCGLHDAALASINEALRLLRPVGSRGSHEQLQAQFLAERERIVDAHWWAAKRQQAQHVDTKAAAAVQVTRWPWPVPLTVLVGVMLVVGSSLLLGAGLPLAATVGLLGGVWGMGAAVLLGVIWMWWRRP